MWISNDVVAIVTSTGSLAIMDMSSILNGETFEKTLVARHSVTNDPRFICVTGWNAQIPSKIKAMCLKCLRFMQKSARRSRNSD